MLLDLSDFKKITRGAEQIFEKDGFIRFYRFNEREMALYNETPGKEPRRETTLASAGIEMEFKTDALSLEISLRVESVTWQTYFTFEVFSDGKSIGSIRNHGFSEIAENFGKRHYPEGEFKEAFFLGEGEKKVRLVFPWNTLTEIKEMKLGGATMLEPIKKDKLLISYGDSITQGCYAVNPSDTYTVRLGEYLGAELVSKAISGEVFFPELADIKNDRRPDYITVAYGTNDWSLLRDKTLFEKNCRAFYNNIAKNYPDTKIIAITPIWRSDIDKIESFGSFFEVRDTIANNCAGYSNVTVIDGFDLVDHDERLFMDRRLHPNAEGFDHYFNNLKKEIGKYLNDR